MKYFEEKKVIFFKTKFQLLEEFLFERIVALINFFLFNIFVSVMY